MTLRVFQKILFNSKCDNTISFKYFRSIHCVSFPSSSAYKNQFKNNKTLVGYFSSERNFSSIQNASSYQPTYTNLVTGSLLYNNHNIRLNKRIPINHCPVSLNSIRHISDLPPAIIVDAVRYNSGIFKIISESICVEWATEILRFMHYQVGLPWWADIVGTTIILRTLVHLPFNILDLQTRARRENLNPELEAVAKRIKMEIQMEAATSEITSSSAMWLYKHALLKEQKELYQRENCHPFKSIAIILLRAPIWLSFSVSVRNMCYMLPQLNAATLQDISELSIGGFGWMQNLIDIDHLFILPVLFGLTSLALLEINHVLYNVKYSKFSKYYTNTVRVLIICLVPITAYIPSALSLFWVTNNLCAISENLLLLSPKIRRLGRIPKSNLEHQNPYSVLYKQILSIFHFK